VSFYILPEAKRLSIPANFDLDKLIEDYPPDFKFTKDFFYYLAHPIHEVCLWNDKIRDSEYVPLSATKLQSLNHDYYRMHLDYLIKYGVLKEDTRYQPKNYCKGFKLLPPYSESEVRHIEITDKKLVKKFTKWNNTSEDTKEKYTHLYNSFIDKRLVIDREAAIQYSKLVYEMDSDNGLENAMKKHNLRLIKIDKFHNNNRGFKQDKWGRIHTNLTGMDRALRNFISYDGNRIVEIDMPNSQPLLSILPLMENYPNININHFHYNHNTNTIMLVDSDDIADDLEIYKYIGLVLNAKLYAYLIDKFNELEQGVYFNSEDSDEVKKQAVKDMVFGTFFSKNDKYFNGKETLHKLFPWVFSAFEKVKAWQHNKLAVTLQGIEAEIVLDTACENIALAYPEKKLWTIHDSISCIEGNEDIVKEYLREAIKQRIGLVPPLKTKIWCPENLDNRMAA